MKTTSTLAFAIIGTLIIVAAYFFDVKNTKKEVELQNKNVDTTTILQHKFVDKKLTK